MIIRQINTEDLESLEGGVNLFGSREWHSLFSPFLKAYEVLSRGEERLGTFLLFEKVKLGLQYTITSPFAPHIGLSLSIGSEKVESRQSTEKAIHKAIADFLLKRKDSLTEIALSVDVVDSQAYTWSGFEVRPRHTYHIDLSHSEEELLGAMSPERRKNVRKAQADNLKVERSDDTERFTRLIHRTIDRQNVSMNKGLLQELLLSEELAANRTMYICTDAKNDLSASLVVHDTEQAYYLIGGYDDTRGHQGAGTLNLWTAIHDAKARGNSIFDLEGSMIPEVERYFRGFGGELKTYFSISKKSMVGKIATKIKGA